MVGGDSAKSKRQVKEYKGTGMPIRRIRTCWTGSFGLQRISGNAGSLYRAILPCFHDNRFAHHFVPSSTLKTLVATGARIERLALRLWTAPDRSCRISSRLFRFACHLDRLSHSRSGAMTGYAESTRSAPTPARTVNVRI